MKYMTRILSVVIALLAALPAVAAPRKAAARNVADGSPDFAYPQTVQAQAAKSMRESAKKGDMQGVVAAAVQTVVASDLISNENAPRMATLLDSLAQASDQPSKAILYSLEAELYTQMYEADRWTYNDRVVPLTPVPANPQEWSAELYALKVHDLVGKSVEPADALQAIPAGDYRKLLSDYSEFDANFYPTLYSVLAQRAIGMLSDFTGGNEAIPFEGVG